MKNTSGQQAVRKFKEGTIMENLPKIARGAWACDNDGTIGGNLTADTLRERNTGPDK